MTLKQKARWEKNKAKGKRRFVLQSTLAYGGGCALAVIVRQIFWKNTSDLEIWSIVGLIATSIVFPAFCAALGALWYWEQNEKNESKREGAI